MNTRAAKDWKSIMRHFRMTAFAALSACFAANAAVADLDGMAPPTDGGFGRWYCGASPGLLVFSRGVSANPAAYGALRAGFEQPHVCV